MGASRKLGPYVRYNEGLLNETKPNEFLGFMISQRGIEANPEKIKAIIDMERSKTQKDIQSLTGQVLFLYLSVSSTAVSSVLICITEKAELTIFYVSKALQNAEIRYPPLEQLALALVVSARRLRPYFQGHEIMVLTNQPLRQVLQKPETSGRLIKWAIELGEFDIQFKPRLA
ncbi:unnamed protein product [Prunus brigantina]